MSRTKRIVKELEDVKSDTESGIVLDLVKEGDLSHLTGTFNGPPGTPYEGGKYKVDIRIPAIPGSGAANKQLLGLCAAFGMAWPLTNPIDPFKPPVMKFDTKVFHPNISSQTGAICLDILKDAWSPILSIKSCLISLQSLLQSPEPNDPQDAQVAGLYLSNKKAFDQTAAEWNKKYAMAHVSSDPIDLYNLDPATVERFQAFGFPKEKIINTLRVLGLKKGDDTQSEAAIAKITDELLK